MRTFLILLLFVAVLFVATNYQEEVSEILPSNETPSYGVGGTEAAPTSTLEIRTWTPTPTITPPPTVAPTETPAPTATYEINTAQNDLAVCY